MAAHALPDGDRCPIGPLGAHTYNWERNECIWCGPNALAWKDGVWRPEQDTDPALGYSAWHVPPGNLDK